MRRLAQAAACAHSSVSRGSATHQPCADGEGGDSAWAMRARTAEGCGDGGHGPYTPRALSIQGSMRPLELRAADKISGNSAGAIIVARPQSPAGVVCGPRQRARARGAAGGGVGVTCASRARRRCRRSGSAPVMWPRLCRAQCPPPTRCPARRVTHAVGLMTWHGTGRARQARVASARAGWLPADAPSCRTFSAAR